MKNNYIDNKDFMTALIEYKQKVDFSKANNIPKPKIPDYIGECFYKLATNLAKRPNFCMYSYKDEMICDAIENCLPGVCKVTTEDGLKTIRDIVKEKYSGKVLSMDENGNFVWNKVIGHRVLQNSGKNKKKWVRVQTVSQKPYLVCTEDHLCAVMDNPLDLNLSYIQAKESVGFWSVRKPSDRNGMSENQLYNKDILSLLIGGIIGDGYIAKDGQISFTHGEVQKEYLLEKYKLFGGKLIENIPGSGFGKGFIVHRLMLPNNSQSRYIRDLIYVDGKKIVSPLFKYMNEISLAMWYMDDGCLGKMSLSNGKTGYYVNLATHGFSLEENEKIATFFLEKWGIECKVTKNSDKKTKTQQYYIRVYSDNAKKFLNMISPYVFESMDYKIPEEYRTKNKKHYALDKSAYVLSKISFIHNVHENTRSSLYDITVENTHNFFAGHSLVHNCLLYMDNFDPNNSKQNPFGYFNKICWYAFLRRMAKEKKQQYIKYKATENFGVLDEEELLELGDGTISQLQIYDNMYEFISEYEDSIEKKKEMTKKKKGLEEFLED